MRGNQMNTAGTGKLDAGTEVTFNSDFSAAGSFLECRFLIYKGKKKKKSRAVLQERQGIFLALTSGKIKYLHIRQRKEHSILCFPQRRFLFFGFFLKKKVVCTW